MKTTYSLTSLALATLLSLSACAPIPPAPAPALTQSPPEDPAFSQLPPDPYPMSRLEGKPWYVESLNGQAVRAGTRIAIRYPSYGRVDGLATCNDFSGSARLTGNTLQFGVLVPQSKRNCSPEMQAQEAAFLKIFQAGGNYVIEADGTFKLVNDQGTLNARRKPQP